MPSDFVFAFPDQSQDVLSAILDQSQDCIKLLTIDGDLEYMNRNGQRAMAVADFGRIAGEKWRDLWPEESRSLVDEAVRKARRGQRARFEGYCPTAAGEPRWWDVGVAPVRNDADELTHIVATSRDITVTMQERLDERLRRERAERSAAHSDDVAREMRHRLKNQLAVVGSVAKLLSRNAIDAKDLSARLDEKLQSLAQAQDLLTIDRDEPIQAADAVRQVLQASGAGDRIEVLSISEGGLGDEAVQLLALILGELQTNSLKYGALSSDSGKITLSGRRRAHGVELHWFEDAGVAVTPPEHAGAGTVLIQRIGSSGGSPATIEWHSGGPSVHFSIRCMD